MCVVRGRWSDSVEGFVTDIFSFPDNHQSTIAP
jgi:hypothetical protein